MKILSALSFSLAIVTVKASCVDPDGNDVTGKFFTETTSGKTIKRDCAWVNLNKQWRCANFINVAENCPATCGISCTPTASPVTEAPTASSAPTAQYPWCSDVTGEFSIDSIDWIKNPKSCDWAGEKDWLRCGYDEVITNCPMTCDFCSCTNNPEPFSISNGSVRSCSWANYKDTWWRCNNYPEIMDNCPLTCGKCTQYTFPSDAPSANPTATPLPTVVTNIALSFILEDIVVPTDPTALAQLYTAIATAYDGYLGMGATISAISLSPINEENRRNVRKLQEVPSALLELNQVVATECESPTDCADADVQNFEAISSAQTGLERALDNNAFAENLREVYPDADSVSTKGYDDSSTTFTSTTTVQDPTAPPTGKPSGSPSEMPTMTPSLTISISPSDKPSVHPSGSPTTAPSKAPTDRPTKSPTKEPSSIPSSAPSKAPSASPSKAPVV